MSLYATAVKKPVTTALVFVAVVIMGLFSLTRLSVDLFPEIETNMIMVMTAIPLPSRLPGKIPKLSAFLPYDNQNNRKIKEKYK